MADRKPWYNEEKVSEVVLALLYVNLWYDGKPPLATCRAWKSLPWEALNRLHELGYIEDPRTKAKSVVFTPEGLQKAREAFLRLFALPDTDLPEDECLEAHLYGVPPERRSEKVLEILKAYAMQKSKKKRR